MKTNKQIIPILTALGLFLVGSGCASKPVVKQGFDFSRYHTFALLPLKAKGTYQDPTIVARLSGPVQETVTATLVAKGFQPVPEGGADFLVKLGFDYFEDQGRYEERMFDLQIIDRHSQEVVWSDFAQRRTDSTLPESVIRQLVTEMLKPFPPGSKAGPR
jgi:hypothetical protein